MVLLALLFSVPFGIGAAIYLVEYAKKGNKLVELVRITAETLTGIPSIIYGLFGMLFFVTALHWGYSHVSWRGNTCDHGSPGHYENDGGSAFVCAGYVP